MIDKIATLACCKTLVGVRDLELNNEKSVKSIMIWYFHFYIEGNLLFIFFIDEACEEAPSKCSLYVLVIFAHIGTQYLIE